MVKGSQLVNIILNEHKNEFSTFRELAENKKDYHSLRLLTARAARRLTKVSVYHHEPATFPLTYERLRKIVFDVLYNGGIFWSWESLF